MRTIEAEADGQLPSFLDEVQRGETIIITRGGKAIARIVPDVPPDHRDVGRVPAEIAALRSTMPRFARAELLAARHEGHER